MKTHSRETAIQFSNIAAKINRGFNFKYDANVTRSIDGLVLWIVNRRTAVCIAIGYRSGEYYRLDLGPRKRNVDPWNRIGSVDDVMNWLAAN